MKPITLKQFKEIIGENAPSSIIVSVHAFYQGRYEEDAAEDCYDAGFGTYFHIYKNQEDADNEEALFEDDTGEIYRGRTIWNRSIKLGRAIDKLFTKAAQKFIVANKIRFQWSTTLPERSQRFYEVVDLDISERDKTIWFANEDDA